MPTDRTAEPAILPVLRVSQLCNDRTRRTEKKVFRNRDHPVQVSIRIFGCVLSQD